MTTQTVATAKRITSIHWPGDFSKTRSRVALMHEYLRRAAWWAEATHVEEWPFFDIAQAVAPQVRASPNQVKEVEAHLLAKLQGGLVVRTCVRALHFAALMDAGTPLPKLSSSVAQPFEPLLVMLERGGGFQLEGSGLIEVDIVGVSKGTRQSNRVDKPVVTLDSAVLDALDAAPRGR